MDTLKFDNSRPRIVLITWFNFLMLVLAVMILDGCAQKKSIVPESPLTSGHVTLSWGDVPQAVTYDVYLSTTQEISTPNARKIPDVKSPYTITDLKPGTTYYIIVTAVNESGPYAYSRKVTYTASTSSGNIHFNDFTTQMRLDQKPAAAEAGAASASPAPANDAQKQSKQKQPEPAIGSGKVTLTWENVANATSYNIYWSDKKGVTKHNGTKIPNVKNPHTITGLKKGRTYFFVVTAVNESGESEVSESISYTIGK